MKYRKGYKYQVAKTFTLQTTIKHFTVSTDSGRVRLNSLGVLTITEGYATDGPSGPTVDRQQNMVAGVGHDALYQLMREGKMPFECWPEADRNYGRWLLEHGAWGITAKVNVFGLGLMKGKYAKVKNRKRIYDSEA